MPPVERSTRWALLLGLGVLLGCGLGWWFLARPKPAGPPATLDRFVGRWAPDWEGMASQPGTLGYDLRHVDDTPEVARVVKAWKRKKIELLVDRGGEVRVVSGADPDAPPVSRHSATLEGDQLRLQGVEADGRALSSAYVTVLRLRRDGVLVWIPLFDRSNERTILLRRR